MIIVQNWFKYVIHIYTNYQYTKLDTHTNSDTAMAKSYTTQNDLLLENLLKYYRTGDRMERILPIINGESSMSIRIIDWFVTNYAKKYYTVYTIRGDEVDPGMEASDAPSTETSTEAAKTVTSRRFKVYIDYKLKLKAYSKCRFDPFCRRERINIPYKNGTHVLTTLGQLNFFRWALDNKIIEYIAKHYAEIEHDMNTRNSIAKKKGGVSQSSVGSDSSEAGAGTGAGAGGDVVGSAAAAARGTSSKSTHSYDSTGSQTNTEYAASHTTSTNGTRKRREELSVSAVRSMKREVVPVIVSFN